MNEKAWHWATFRELAGSPIWARIDNETGLKVYADGSVMPGYLQ